jgi:hypothetical protein
MNNKRISGKKGFVLRWVMFLFFVLPVAVAAGTVPGTGTVKGTGADTDTDIYTKTDEYAPGCGHLRGFIYKPDGETPLFGAQVVLEDVETRRVFRSNVTDSTGDYEMLDIPAGHYMVHILSRNREYKVKTVDFLIKIRESKTTTISFSLKKSPGGLWFFLLEPCCEAAVITGTALTTVLIKKLIGEKEQSPTQR